MAFTRITVKGKFLEIDGETLAKGSVTFDLLTRMQDAGTDEVVAAGTTRVKLVDGEFVVDLVATNDPDTQPAGATYRVTESIRKAVVRTYDIELDYNAPGGEVQLADLAPVTSTEVFSYLLVSNFDDHLAGEAAHDAANLRFIPPEGWNSTTVQDAIVEARSPLSDADLVHLTGSETVTGPKDFTGGLTKAGVAVETTTGAQSKADTARDAAVSQLLGGAPSAALDTLLELGARLVNDEDAAAALATQISNEVTNRTNAVSAEVTNRTNAIAALSTVYIAIPPGITDGQTVVFDGDSGLFVAANGAGGVTSWDPSRAFTATDVLAGAGPNTEARFLRSVGVASAVSTPLSPGEMVRVYVIADGAHNVTFPDVDTWMTDGGTAPDISTDLNGAHHEFFIEHNGAEIIGHWLSGGAAQTPVIPYRAGTRYWSGGPGGALAMTLNLLYLRTYFVHSRQAFEGLEIEVTTLGAGSLPLLGCWAVQMTGANAGKPGALLGTTAPGAIDASTIGSKYAPFVAGNTTIAPQWVYLGAVAQGAGCSVRGIVADMANPSGLSPGTALGGTVGAFTQSGVSAALPNPPSVNNVVTTGPRVTIRTVT